MTTTTQHTEIIVSEPMFSDGERTALAGFLAGYSGLTREAYALDLRQFVTWCEEHEIQLFGARRADIECFGRDLEACGCALQRWLAGSAPSPASTATPSKRSSSTTLRQYTSAVRVSTTSRTPLG